MIESASDMPITPPLDAILAVLPYIHSQDFPPPPGQHWWFPYRVAISGTIYAVSLVIVYLFGERPQFPLLLSPFTRNDVVLMRRLVDRGKQVAIFFMLLWTLGPPSYFMYEYNVLYHSAKHMEKEDREVLQHSEELGSKYWIAGGLILAAAYSKRVPLVGGEE